MTDQLTSTRSSRDKARVGAAARAALAVGYCRRSTDRQEQSIPDQQRVIERSCKDQGLSILRWYIDDAISGTSTSGRKGFQTLIQDAQALSCDFSKVVCYDVKRFGRVDNDEAGYYRHVLRSSGVEVVYAAEGFAGGETDDLLRPVKQWQARQESKDLSKVTIRGLLSKSGSGAWMGGAPPYGYDLAYESQVGLFLFRLRYNRDGTKAVLNESGQLVRTLVKGESIAVSRKDRCKLVFGEVQRVKVIKQIFAWYTLDRLGFKAIADRLNSEGVATARSRDWADHYSGRWALTTIRSILVNPAYTGDMAWNRRTDARFHKIVDGRAVERPGVHSRRLEPNLLADWLVVSDAHPGLVTRRVWAQAQAMLMAKLQSEHQRGVNPRTGRPAGPDSQPRPSGAVVGGGRERAAVVGASRAVWTGPRARFLLSGLVTCGRCGARYEGYTQRSRKKDVGGNRLKVFTYACGAAIRQGKSVCTLGEVKQDELENMVVQRVLEHHQKYLGPKGRRVIEQELDKDVGVRGAVAVKQLLAISKQLEAIDEKVRRLVDSLGPATRSAVERRLGELETERHELETRALGLRAAALNHEERAVRVEEYAAFVEGLEAALRTGGLGLRRMALRRCVQGVVFNQAKGNVVVKVAGVGGTSVAV